MQARWTRPFSSACGIDGRLRARRTPSRRPSISAAKRAERPRPPRPSSLPRAMRSLRFIGRSPAGEPALALGHGSARRSDQVVDDLASPPRAKRLLGLKMHRRNAGVDARRARSSLRAARTGSPGRSCRRSPLADAPPGMPERFATSEIALDREAEQVERLEREADVLHRRNVRRRDEQQLVAAVERREHRAVEERRRVDDDRVVHPACRLEDRRDARGVDLLALLGPERCRQDVQPASVLDDVTAELLGVEVAGRRGKIVQRLARADRDRGRCRRRRTGRRGRASSVRT